MVVSFLLFLYVLFPSFELSIISFIFFFSLYQPSIIAPWVMPAVPLEELQPVLTLVLAPSTALATLDMLEMGLSALVSVFVEDFLPPFEYFLLSYFF
jgi:hypothetical protein